MIKIKVRSTGEIKSVTPNVAHDLIDRGLADVSTGKRKVFYRDRQVTQKIRPVKIHSKEDQKKQKKSKTSYGHRQMSASRPSFSNDDS